MGMEWQGNGVGKGMSRKGMEWRRSLHSFAPQFLCPLHSPALLFLCPTIPLPIFQSRHRGQRPRNPCRIFLVAHGLTPVRNSRVFILAARHPCCSSASARSRLRNRITQVLRLADPLQNVHRLIRTRSCLFSRGESERSSIRPSAFDPLPQDTILPGQKKGEVECPPTAYDIHIRSRTIRDRRFFPGVFREYPVAERIGHLHPGTGRE